MILHVHWLDILFFLILYLDHSSFFFFFNGLRILLIVNAELKGERSPCVLKTTVCVLYELYDTCFKHAFLCSPWVPLAFIHWTLSISLVDMIWKRAGGRNSIASDTIRYLNLLKKKKEKDIVNFTETSPLVCWILSSTIMLVQCLCIDLVVILLIFCG